MCWPPSTFARAAAGRPSSPNTATPSWTCDRVDPRTAARPSTQTGRRDPEWCEAPRRYDLSTNSLLRHARSVMARISALSGTGPSGFLRSASRTHAGIAQKNVVVCVLVPLSQVMLTFQFRNSGIAGTITRSYVELAGKKKLRTYPSESYVHWAATPLRSLMGAVRRPTRGAHETAGPCRGWAGGAGW